MVPNLESKAITTCEVRALLGGGSDVCPGAIVAIRQPGGAGWALNTSVRIPSPVRDAPVSSVKPRNEPLWRPAQARLRDLQARCIQPARRFVDDAKEELPCRARPDPSNWAFPDALIGVDRLVPVAQRLGVHGAGEETLEASSELGRGTRLGPPVRSGGRAPQGSASAGFGRLSTSGASSIFCRRRQLPSICALDLNSLRLSSPPPKLLPSIARLPSTRRLAVARPRAVHLATLPKASSDESIQRLRSPLGTLPAPLETQRASTFV